jgi:hypothetical protein
VFSRWNGPLPFFILGTRNLPPLKDSAQKPQSPMVVFSVVGGCVSGVSLEGGSIREGFRAGVPGPRTGDTSPWGRDLGMGGRDLGLSLWGGRREPINQFSPYGHLRRD